MVRIPDIVVRFVSSAPSAAKLRPTSPKSQSGAGKRPRIICEWTPDSNMPMGIEARSGIGSNEVTLPWPPRELSPNWRGHWAAKSKAVKSYRLACYVLAKEAGLAFDGPGEVHLWITFNKPSRRAMDQDNMVASLKSGLDGLADALKIDDSRFVLHPLVSDKIAGTVVVRLSGAPGA